MMDRPSAILRLSDDLASGTVVSSAEFFQLVYDELRSVAAAMLRSERREHTLQPTALVNEAYLKIAGVRPGSWNGRDHFRAIAAVAMRQILINYARERRALKRGGPRGQRVTISDAPEPLQENAEIDLLALDEALEKLAAADERQARIVEMKYFAGMSNEQIAGVLEISERTVKREWRMARAWLTSFLNAEAKTDGDGEGDSG